VADFDRELDLLVAAGANTVRIDLSWSTPEPGARASSPHARARGLRTIVTLFTTPCWGFLGSGHQTGMRGRMVGARGRLLSAHQPGRLRRGGGWVAAHRGDSMAAIEIWNEPN
jgi:hypothetical protein